MTPTGSARGTNVIHRRSSWRYRDLVTKTDAFMDHPLAIFRQILPAQIHVTQPAAQLVPVAWNASHSMLASHK
jgi:hypothetical protein